MTVQSLIILIISGIGVVLVQSAEQPLPHSISPKTLSEARTLVDKLSSNWDQVDRWLIEYQATPRPTDKLPPVHRIMAVGSSRRFYHMGSYLSQRSPTRPWHLD